MSFSDRRERFRQVLQGNVCYRPGSVFDPLSARIAEDLGYQFGMLAGSSASLTVLGAPDIVLLTLTEFAEQARRICRAFSLPLFVDADHGYGNALNAGRTVEELETAGVAGLTIEDTVLPAAFGASGRTTLISTAEAVGKLQAALSARQDSRLAIIGRTGAMAFTGIEDAIARAKTYEAAGVDAIFFFGVKTRAQLDALTAATTLPLILGKPGLEVANLEYLATRRVKICVQGHQPILAATQAVYATLKALKDGVPPAELKGLPSNKLMERVTRGDQYEKMTNDFLGPASPGAKQER
jgi:oxaloacetate decarboxylase